MKTGAITRPTGKRPSARSSTCATSLGGESATGGWSWWTWRFASASRGRRRPRSSNRTRPTWTSPSGPRSGSPRAGLEPCGHHHPKTPGRLGKAAMAAPAWSSASQVTYLHRRTTMQLRRRRPPPRVPLRRAPGCCCKGPGRTRCSRGTAATATRLRAAGPTGCGGSWRGTGCTTGRATSGATTGASAPTAASRASHTSTRMSWRSCGACRPRAWRTCASRTASGTSGCSARPRPGSAWRTARASRSARSSLAAASPSRPTPTTLGAAARRRGSMLERCDPRSQAPPRAGKCGKA
mmetsp:Transcript_24844/g.55973  ORF Transcript_24844/g.55973 Transcript_24844/m.55973 type:complete len:295 (-) Transcript_24844:226-1110(-)